MRTSAQAAAALLGLSCLASGAMKTGPAVGARIPAFEAVDQNGRRRAFDDLKGPKGLVLVFVRSADW